MVLGYLQQQQTTSHRTFSNMDEIKKLHALNNVTGQTGDIGNLHSAMASSSKQPTRVQPQQNDHNPSDSGSDSDEYLTSGRAITKNSDVVYTTISTFFHGSMSHRTPMAFTFRN